MSPYGLYILIYRKKEADMAGRYRVRPTHSVVHKSGKEVEVVLSPSVLVLLSQESVELRERGRNAVCYKAKLAFEEQYPGETFYADLAWKDIVVTDLGSLRRKLYRSNGQ